MDGYVYALNIYVLCSCFVSLDRFGPLGTPSGVQSQSITHDQQQVDTLYDTNHACSSYDFSPGVANILPFSLYHLDGSSGTSDASQIFPFEKHEENLQKTCRAAAEISQEVDKLQSNLNWFIQTLGLDPGLFNTSGHHGHVGGVGDANGKSSNVSNDASVCAEGDVDAFTNVNGSDLNFGTFLMDTVPCTTDRNKDHDLEQFAEQLDLDLASVMATAEVHDTLQGGQARLPPEQHHVFWRKASSQDSDVRSIVGSSDVGLPQVSARAASEAGAGPSYSFSSTRINSVGSPSAAALPPMSSTAPMPRHRKRKRL